MGAKIISEFISGLNDLATCAYNLIVFSLVSSVAMVHAVRDAMRSLKKTGTDFSSARGMDPKAFFEVMGEHHDYLFSMLWINNYLYQGLNEVIELDAKAGGSAFQIV